MILKSNDVHFLNQKTTLKTEIKPWQRFQHQICKLGQPSLQVCVKLFSHLESSHQHCFAQFGYPVYISFAFSSKSYTPHFQGVRVCIIQNNPGHIGANLGLQFTILIFITSVIGKFIKAVLGIALNCSNYIV